MNIDEMSFVDRNLCKLLQKSIENDGPRVLAPWLIVLLEAKGQNADWTNKEYLKPIIKELDFL